jgi:hypothetical protein
MGEPFDHCPAGWIRQSRERCTQSIHNHMVVDYRAMSSVKFATPDFCLLAPLSHQPIKTMRMTVASRAGWAHRCAYPVVQRADKCILKAYI